MCFTIPKAAIAICLFVIVNGCSSHLDKSIFEPLTVAEIKKSIDKDSLFKNTFQLIQHIKDTVLKSDIERAKFADLTYNRVYKLLKFSLDTIFFKPIKEGLEKEWQNKYGVLQKKVDSVSNYWKDFLKANSLDQYVKIELVEIDKEYYSYSAGIRNINLGFRLTPLKGQIDQLRFGYEIKPKIYEKESDVREELLVASFDKSWCLMSSPIINPTVRYWEANYKNEKMLQDRNIESVLRDYNVYIEVDQIRIDGKNTSADDFKIPTPVKNYWRYETSESYMKNLYAEDILKETLNLEYTPDYKYISQGIQNKLKEKDSLVMEFINYTIEKD